MSIPEIPSLNDALARLRRWYNHFAKMHENLAIDDDEQFAILAVRLGPGVDIGEGTDLGDLPGLGSQITAITGITDIKLCGRGKAEAVAGEGFQTVLYVDTLQGMPAKPE